MRKMLIFLAALSGVICFISLFFLQNQNGFFSIPLGFSIYKIPTTYVEIEGKRYEVEIDLGSKTALSLKKAILDQIEKTPNGVSRWMNFSGEKYESPKYMIKNVRIGDLSLKSTDVKAESAEFADVGSILIQDPLHETGGKAGRIGREFFLNQNLFLDCGCSVFFVCKNRNDIKKKHYQLDRFVQTPMYLTSDGIVVEVEMDMGSKRFIIDTGSTISAIRSGNIQGVVSSCNNMPVYEGRKFVISGKDFGRQRLYLLDMSAHFKESDGILGMDFLNEHAVYLDFAEGVAYIGKSAHVHE